MLGVSSAGSVSSAGRGSRFRLRNTERGRRVSIVCEQFVRLLHHAGMPKEDADYIHGDGKTVNEILLHARPRSTLFTGSGRIAEKLASDLHGKVRLFTPSSREGGGGLWLAW